MRHGLGEQDWRSSEWETFARTQAGKWRGLWTTYDHNGAQQGAPDWIDTNLELSPDGKRIRHVNTLFVGATQSDYVNTVETREIIVGEYTADTFRHRAHGSCYLHGPGVTPRGDMTTELGVCQGELRVRCIVVHRPVQERGETRPPSRLILERVHLVTEGVAPAEGSIPIPPTSLPRLQIHQPSWLGLWRGYSSILESAVDGEVAEASWHQEQISPTHLRKCRCSGVDQDGEGTLSLEADGGIRLEAPRAVDAGQPTEMQFGWAFSARAGGDERRIVRANVRFRALTRIVDTPGVESDPGSSVVRVSPPELLRFAVEELEPVPTAGLR